MDLRVQYQGNDAERHVLRAFEGTQSLEGIARAMTLVTHYASTGTVRKRYPFEGSPPIYLVGTEDGSFDAIFRLLTQPNNSQITSIAGAVAVSVAAGIIIDLMKLVFSRAIGQHHSPTNRTVQNEDERKPGNIEALTEAVEPALKRAHSIVNSGAGTINIYNGDANLIRFDARSKSYLEESVIEHEVKRKEVSVNMLNVNTRYGSVFDFEMGRTISIRVLNNAASGTLPALASSLRTFSRRVSLGSNLRGLVTITYITETTLDGTPKRYIVQRAEMPETEGK